MNKWSKDWDRENISCQRQHRNLPIRPSSAGVPLLANKILVTCYCYVIVPYKASHALPSFLIYCVSTAEFYSFVIHLPEISGKYQLRHLVANEEKLGEKWRQILRQNLSFYSAGFFKMLQSVTTCSRRP